MPLLLISFVRTITPGIVGMVVGWFTALGLTVDPEFEGALTAVLGLTFMGLYYLVVRLIEQKFPKVGILLGYAKSPDSYSQGPGVEITKPQGNPEITVHVENPAIASEPVVIDGTHLSTMNSSVVSNLDRVDGPDPRA